MNKLLGMSILTLVAVVMLAACGGGGGGGGSATLVSIEVTPANTSIAKDTTQQFSATGTYSDNTTKDITASVTWSSSNTGVATVSSTGLTTAVAAGSTTIKAESGDISGTTALTVTNATLASIAVTPANPTISKSTTQQFTATGTFSDNSTQDMTTQVTWSSSKTAVATITSAGLATAVAAGTTTITAKWDTISGTATLTVTTATLASITVTPANKSISKGTTQQFTATGKFSDNNTQDLTSQVTWTSSKTPVATISSAGLATGVSAGTTTITAKSGAVEGSTTLTVVALAAIEISPAETAVAAGKTQQYTAMGTLSNSTTQDLTSQVTWSSSDTGKATINSSGLASVKSIGTTTITASYSGITSNAATLTITSAINLAETGQIVSYDTGSVDDGALKKGVAWPGQRFTDNTDGTVTDNLTGLIWTKDANAPGPAGCNPAANKTWQAALDYVACLNADSYLGGGWRLPNRKELRSLIDYSQNAPALASGHPFTSVQVGYYWSSTTDTADSADAWAVLMGYGHTMSLAKTLSNSVWTVRSGQEASAPAPLPATGQIISYGTGSIDDGALKKGIAWPSPRFTAGTGAGADCVTDNLTGLMWPKAPGATTRSWQQALDYADGLSLCGFSDWRLPNVYELESLVHAAFAQETCGGSACASNAAWLNDPARGFTGVQAGIYWTSTTNDFNTAEAWILYTSSDVTMSDGSLSAADKSNLYHTLPVRAGQ